jgi:hypothetical protein
MDLNDEVHVPVLLLPGKQLMAICMGSYGGPTAGLDN